LHSGATDISGTSQARKYPRPRGIHSTLGTVAKSKIASVRIFGETFKTEAIDDLDSHVNVRFAPEAVALGLIRFSRMPFS
jgi:predicted nucleotidyltransferase